MREEKAFLACSLVVFVLLSSFGAVNWRSKAGEWHVRTSAGLIIHAILTYHLTSADNSSWVLAKELIENDNYSGAISELSGAENNLISFFDNMRYVKGFSLLEDEKVYDNIAQLAQNLAEHVASLIENLQTGEVQQSLINLIDNEFENLYKLFFDTFEQEGWQIYRAMPVWFVNNAGQIDDIKYIPYILLIENVKV